jgi:glutamate-1-semialdehyde aminotransferase
VVLLAAAFLGGFVPQWIKVRNLRTQVETMDLQLRLATAHGLLGVASQEAQRNNYASAAQAAAQFFDQCATLARTEAFEKEPRTRVALLSYTAQRDQVMALLSAADPAAREKLAGMFLAMDGVLARRLPALSS